ncbi:hypothetical protein H0H81_008246 [Sphagnurus paluster]|uniref:Uncharacterized protein n=1 Tax=Sphagnurus paluster TaxID=117069 RepID=A0A9P7FWI6_9AGAR|nr:hypothetical protein H0H81_008246 [Sphagnurus paluster]
MNDSSSATKCNGLHTPESGIFKPELRAISTRVDRHAWRSSTRSGEEGASSLPCSGAHEPLVVQFCADSPKRLLASAKLIEDTATSTSTTWDARRKSHGPDITARS